MTAWCKKCNKEVAPGEVCPICGSKIAKSAVHVAWCRERKPAKDWMCWNSVMRLAVPAYLLVILLVLLPELFSFGAEGLQTFFTDGRIWALVIPFGVCILLTGIWLLLRGSELMDYEVSGKGVHVRCYLHEITALRLLAHLRSPALQMQADEKQNVILLSEQEIPWRQISRVQLWPEKCMVLFYSPRWWMRAYVVCTPESWRETLTLVQDKLGKKKNVDLPYSVREMNKV